VLKYLSVKRIIEFLMLNFEYSSQYLGGFVIKNDKEGNIKQLFKDRMKR
jgi:hypothetical protein